MNNLKCINTDCPNFSSEHRWNCYTNLSEERIKDCFNFISEQGNLKLASCFRKECTLYDDGKCTRDFRDFFSCPNRLGNRMKCKLIDCSYFDKKKEYNCSYEFPLKEGNAEVCIKSNYAMYEPASDTVASMLPKEDVMIYCAKGDCINFLGSRCQYKYMPEYDSKGCIHYKKKENKCNTTICVYYIMEINGCGLTYVPLKTHGVCSRYVTEPIKESTCPHCGKNLSDTSIEIARKILSEIRGNYDPNSLPFKIDKMAENYEEAIIDAVEDEQRRIVRLLIDLDAPADTSYVKWSEIKNIIIPKIQGEIK